MITAILCIFSFVAGLLVMRKHRAKADTVEAKGKALLDALKGRK